MFAGLDLLLNVLLVFCAICKRIFLLDIEIDSRVHFFNDLIISKKI
jgi:hypothetical protein